MKRTKPVATPPTNTVGPEIKNPSLPGEARKDQLPQPPPLASVEGKGSGEQAGTSPKSDSVPLGLATTEPLQTPTPQPEKTAPPATEPKPKQLIERSAIPPILLEGDEAKSAPEAGPAHKFASSSRSTDAQAEAARPQLPESYGTGRLLLTARDPNCLYAHWDLTPEQQQQHLNVSGQKQLLVRIYKDSLSGQVVSEVPVGAEAHHSFIPVDAPGARRFVAELGYYPAEGHWRSIAAAESATAALAALPVSEPTRFATLSFSSPESMPGTRAEQSPLMVAKPGGIAVPEDRPVRNFPLPKPFGSVNPLVQRTGTGQIVPPEESQGWQELPSDREAIDAFGDLVDEEPGAPGQTFAQPNAHWSEARQRALAELIGWSVIRGESISSGGIEELIRGIGSIPLPAELSSSGVAGPELSSAGLGSLPPEPQGFWFNINAELVVYGATQPDATVTIGGRPIALRPDGTFSYRFALPDGNYELPVVAYSPQGEQRAAKLDFYRGTAYSGGAVPQPQRAELKPPGVESVA